MASYLAEVLSCAETMELEQIKTRSPVVAQHVETCKSEIDSYLENVYVRFLERPRQNKNLATKINRLQEETTNLMNTANEVVRKDLTNAETDVCKHVETLNRVNATISGVKVIYELHEALMNIQSLEEQRAFTSCMEEMLKTEEKLENVDMLENPSVFRALSRNFLTRKASLLHKLSNAFSDHVVLKSLDKKSVLELKVRGELKEVLSAFFIYNTSIKPLDKVIRFLWTCVFTPIVDCTTQVTTTFDQTSILEVDILDPTHKSTYSEVFANLKKVLEFLSKFDIPLGDNLNLPLSEGFTVLSYIGRDIRDNLSELIIKHCLQDTIPSTKEGLQQYNVVVQATEDLEKALVAANIFAKDTVSILEYANNMDVLFINKKCQVYVNLAQELMKKDLHSMVEVGESQTSVLAAVEFPRCAISRNVIDILDLLEKMLTEIPTASEVCAGRLFIAMRTICTNYVNFVPKHHQKFLQTIPQQIALFYNNCMYIAHKLLRWTDTHLPTLPSSLNVPKNFKDEGFQLQTVATKMLIGYVDSQIQQIHEIMKDSGLDKRTLEQVEPATDKSLRQCLRQQELLKTVWHKVLPYEMYNKSLGAILNALCADLVSAIVKLEDISSDSAEQLVELFKMVQTRGPKLFTDPKEVSLFVGDWYRINELAFVLNAGLVDINDRWADGKGPLGLQFKPEELRQLVRALFQNTEQRAALITKIRD